MTTELPIACTLQPSELAERTAAARRLAAEALLDSAVTARSASLRFRPSAEAALRELVAAESQCCAFLDFELVRRVGALELTATGPAAEQWALALFGSMAPKRRQSRRADSNR